MAHVITIGNQKGGVGKTTTAALLAYFLAKNHRVLAIDFDMQANLSFMLSNKHHESDTVLDALKEGINERNCKPVSVNGVDMHLLPANDMLALYNAQSADEFMQLDRVLAPIKEQFDFCIIDTPPSLGAHLLTALMASDSALLMTMTHPYSVDGAVKFTKRLHEIRQFKPALNLLGVAITMFEQTKFNKGIANQIRNGFGDLVFNTTILKRADIMKMTAHGIKEKTKSQKDALEQYKQLAQEVEKRVRQ